ncbi:MAG: hypothetical protein GY928_24325 [Colwellia sp.]|nr:hypothetical protein [Colwellia sp.]
MFTVKVSWKVISFIALFLGIISSIISIWTFLKVDRLEKFAEEAQQWAISVELNEPSKGENASSFALMIAGKINFRTTANESAVRHKVNLDFYKKKIELVSFIRPILSEKCAWYRQSKPVIYQDGSFEGLVFLSEGDPTSKKIEHQIIALIVPKDSVSRTFEHKELPFYIVASNIVSMKRIKNENTKQ